MKNVNWYNSRIRNLVDHETPFKEIDLPGGYTIRLWWTKGGMYGPQVLAIIYGLGEEHEDFPVYSITDGCGYSKEHHALDECFSHLGRAPRGFEKTQRMFPYHVGGNYYRVPRKHWLKY